MLTTTPFMVFSVMHSIDKHSKLGKVSRLLLINMILFIKIGNFMK